MRGWLAFLIAACAAGCAYGRVFRYHDIMADLPRPGVSPVAVATLDKREYVVSGDSDQSYAGMIRGRYAIPFDARTEGGNAMSEEITRIVIRSFETNGVKGVAVSTTPRDRRLAARERLVTYHAPRSVLITLREWQSDTYKNTSLYYDVEIQVLDEGGQVLASTRCKGEDDLGGEPVEPDRPRQGDDPRGSGQPHRELLRSTVDTIRTPGGPERVTRASRQPMAGRVGSASVRVRGVGPCSRSARGSG